MPNSTIKWLSSKLAPRPSLITKFLPSVLGLDAWPRGEQQNPTALLGVHHVDLMCGQLLHKSGWGMGSQGGFPYIYVPSPFSPSLHPLSCTYVTCSPLPLYICTMPLLSQPSPSCPVPMYHAVTPPSPVHMYHALTAPALTPSLILMWLERKGALAFTEISCYKQNPLDLQVLIKSSKKLPAFSHGFQVRT